MVVGNVPQASLDDYEACYVQGALDAEGLAEDVQLVLPRRVRQYNPTYSTLGVSAALARLDGWGWGARYIVLHILTAMGGLAVEGLNDAKGRPLPASRDTANQIAWQLGTAVSTVRNTLSRACAEGILATTSGTVEARGAGRVFCPGRKRGPRIVHPGPVLVALLDAWD